MDYIATVRAPQHAAPRGWGRWVYSTNHKDIGTMYLVFSVVSGFIGAFILAAIWRRRGGD